MHLPEQGFYSAFYLSVVWREKYTHLLLLLFYYKPQPKSKPYRSQCCSVFNDKHAGALQSLQSLQTDRKGEGKKQKHEDLRMVILRRQEFRSSELREEDASSPHSEESPVSPPSVVSVPILGLLCKRKISHNLLHNLQMSKWIPTAWRCQHLFPIVPVYSQGKRLFT